MVGDNPYAPPVESADAHEPERSAAGGLAISEQGWELVESMAKWMRIVSALQYALGALVVVGALFFSCRFAALSGRTGAALLGVTLGAMLIYGTLAFLGATWLRRAARHFLEGVVRDHESPLARGFRNLRLYFILYGIFTVLGLAAEVVKAALGG